MPSIRVQKVADLIRDEMAVLLREEVSETRQALVTVTSVGLTADMRIARVRVSIFPSTAPRDEILSALRSSSGRLKRLMGRQLRLRHVPDLEFLLDTSAEEGDRIERLLRESAGGDQHPTPPHDEEE